MTEEAKKPTVKAPVEDLVKNVSSRVIQLESGPLKPGETGKATPYEKVMLGEFIA